MDSLKGSLLIIFRDAGISWSLYNNLFCILIFQSLIKLRDAGISWIRYNNFFCIPTIYISALIFGQIFAEYAVVGFLITYFTDKAGLLLSVIVVNIYEGLSSVLVIVIAHISDAYLGRFKMVLISSFSYALGLLLLWVRHLVDNIWIFFFAVVLLAIGKAGQESTQKEFLADQIRNRLSDNDQKQVEVRTDMGWRIPRFVGAVAGTFALANASTDKSSKISAFVMSMACLLFMCGFTTFHREQPTGSPFSVVYSVFMAAIANRKLGYSDEPNDYYENHGGEVPLKPTMTYLRWLDKSALVVETIPISAEEKKRNGKLCTVAQVQQVKLLLIMLPMWGTFMVYCIMEATGSTFFFEQSSNLIEYRIGTWKLPLSFFNIIEKSTKFAVFHLYRFIIRNSSNELSARKARIGFGMLCCLLCCVAAREVEIVRLGKVTEEGFLDMADTDDHTVGMSIFWLTIQFFLLGLMRGLAADGLEDFFYHYVGNTMKRYGPPFNELVLGIGKFLSLFLLGIFHNWFGDTINHSHLDNYYGMIAVFIIFNLVLYTYLFKCLYKEVINIDDNSMEQNGRISLPV